MTAARYIKLDELRGLTLISMIAYHACWDLVYIKGWPLEFYTGKGAFVWQQSICWTFILLSGFCATLGHHPLRRGLTVFGAGALVSVITYWFAYEERILFGILTLLGSSMIVFAMMRKLLERIPCEVGLLLSALAFVLSYSLKDGYLGIGDHRLALPGAWYVNWFTTYLGLPQEGFFSTDYFPLIPWFFLFLAGHFLGALLQKKGAMEYLRRGHFGALEWMGRHSLGIYLLHQPGLALCLGLLG